MREAPARYWITRFLILRLLGLVYVFAFLSAAWQVVPLVGRDGLLPAGAFLDRVALHSGSSLDGFLRVPTLFWVDVSDGTLLAAAWIGVALSLAVLLGYANAVLMAVLWALYLSFIHIGQDWYGYGWEIQLAETGFLAIFLCPLLDGRPFPRRPPPSWVLWLFRWLIFRIMIGAGLIKLRGDPCWRQLTCLRYHYETQPIPNPLSRFLHFMPPWIHALGVLYNHLTELVAPWFVFTWTRARRVAGGVMLALQIMLILSGNLSFLNYLTIVPILACFDDELLRWVMPRFLVERADRAERAAQPSRAQHVAVAGLVVVVALLSIAPVTNLVSSRQVMNTSFNSLDLVNTYGAFGTVGRERFEIVFEGTRDAAPSENARWLEYELPCKPGDPLRGPCVVSPYQPRLAWQLWFAAMSTPDRYPWTLHFVWKLLHNDPALAGLVEGNPFPDAPPRFIRARLYRYAFARSDEPGGAWWKRTLVGEWLPPLSADDRGLQRFLIQHGWIAGG